MYRGILFDLDGTLLDTSEGVKRSVLYTIEQMNLPQISEAEIASFIGPPIYNSLRIKFQLTEEEAKQGTEIFRSAYKDKFLYEAEVYAGVIETLEYLKKMNLKIGVATYKREDYARQILEFFGIAQYCDVIVGSDYENKLTKTDIVQKCFDGMGILKEEAVLVGDTMHDAIGAKNFGIDFVAVTYGFGFKKDCLEGLDNDNCAKVIDDMEALKSLI